MILPVPVRGFSFDPCGDPPKTDNVLATYLDTASGDAV